MQNPDTADNVPADPANPPRPFLGWYVVFAGFTAQLFAHMAGLGSAGFFVTALEAEFETDAATISAGIGMSIIIMAVLGPAVGSWIDRGSQKWIMIAGACLMSLGLILSSMAVELWQLAIAFCVVANLGIVMFGPMPSVALVSRWFVRRRGLAVGIAVAGATAASAIGPIVATSLIEMYSWRVALMVMAGISVVIVVPVFFLFITKSPEEVGQFPDGDTEAPPEVELDGERSVAGEVFRSPNFYLISIAMALIFSSPIVTTVHFPAFAEKELGISGADLSPVFVLIAVFSLLGKLVFGVLSDRIDLRLAILVNAGLLAGGWAILQTRPDMSMIYVAGVLFGSGVGAAGPLHAVLIGRCFGRAAFGQIMGLGGLIALPLVAGAAPLAGYLAIESGNYTSAFQMEIVVVGLAGLCALFLRIPAVEEVEATPTVEPG